MPKRTAPSIAAIAVLVLLASAAQAHGAPHQVSHSTVGPSLSPRATMFRPASLGLSSPPDGAAPSPSSPDYDEQLGATFTANFNALAYNVSAVAQMGADGYGPAYLLNGLTSSGYWYQAGISYHWPNSDGTFEPGFGFSYQVYSPSGASVFPANGSGLATFSKVVNSGDSVLLSLNFTGLNVQLLAHDWDTGASANASFSNEGSSVFVGDPQTPNNSHGFFTGLMTEWYHTAPYSGNEGRVSYTNDAVALTSAWMWVDEFDIASTSPLLFDSLTQGPLVFANEQQIYPFSAHGATMFMSAHQFVTGVSTIATSSRVTITPAANEVSSPGLSANYTLAGELQTAVLTAGATVLQADPGSSITVSINSSSPSGLDRWVFNGTSGTQVTFAAGTNATYVYYHLVQETVSYEIAGGAQALPASSPLELDYETAPSVASRTTSSAPATQQLTTAPFVVYALLGSDASISGTVPGVTGERWASTTQSWTVSGPDSIPSPIQLYQQYEVSVGYSIVGGGTPSETPEFNSTAFGSPATLQMSAVPTVSWFDGGSAYSVTSVINGSEQGERWLGPTGGVPPTITSPDETLSEVYTHQYYAVLGVNDASGGAVSQGSAWFDAGTSLRANASAKQGWQFESWNGSGAGAYTGSSPSIDVMVTGPLNENATFYVQLAVTAGSGTSVTFSYASQTGIVQAGTTKTLYVPPSSSVALRAVPSDFIHSFASWQGTGIANATKPSMALVVDSPGAVTSSSSYNYLVILAAAATVALIPLAGSLLIRNRRRAKSGWAFPPT